VSHTIDQTGLPYTFATHFKTLDYTIIQTEMVSLLITHIEQMSPSSCDIRNYSNEFACKREADRCSLTTDFICLLFTILRDCTYSVTVNLSHRHVIDVDYVCDSWIDLVHAYV